MYYFRWLFLFVTCDAARILAVLPMRSASHFQYHESILQKLGVAGHHVTIIGPFPPKTFDQYFTFISTRTGRTENVCISPLSRHDLKSMSWLESLKIGVDIVEKDCHDLLQMKEIVDLLSSSVKNYDVMFVELLPMYECYLPIAKKLGIPVIGISTYRYWLLVDNELGNSHHPAVIPFEFSSTPKTLTFYQRLQNAFNYLILNFFYAFDVAVRVEKAHRLHNLTYDSKNDKVISLAFVNNHPSVFPRSLVPNIIEVGGIHLKSKTDPLPEDFKKFIEESKHGVILFTFGSVVKSNVINTEMRNMFRDAFAEIPQRVIWKFEDKVESISDNVMLSKSVPQQDILAHDNVKAFISHCGIFGTYEAINVGKPIISIPLFADQPSNAALLSELGVAVYLDFQTLTKEKLLHALDAVVNDTRYRERMRKLSQTFKDRPLSPQDAVVYWTEYVIKHHGALHLRTAAVNLPLYQYLLLDVLVFAGVGVAAVCCTLFFSLKKIRVFCVALVKPRAAASIKSKKCR